MSFGAVFQKPAALGENDRPRKPPTIAHRILVDFQCYESRELIEFDKIGLGYIIAESARFWTVIDFTNGPDQQHWVLFKLKGDIVNGYGDLVEFVTMTKEHPNLFVYHDLIPYPDDCHDGHLNFACQRNQLDLLGFLIVCPAYPRDSLLRYVVTRAFEIVRMMSRYNFCIDNLDLTKALQFWRPELLLRLGEKVFSISFPFPS